MIIEEISYFYLTLRETFKSDWILFSDCVEWLCWGGRSQPGSRWRSWEMTTMWPRTRSLVLRGCCWAGERMVRRVSAVSLSSPRMWRRTVTRCRYKHRQQLLLKKVLMKFLKISLSCCCILSAVLDTVRMLIMCRTELWHCKCAKMANFLYTRPNCYVSCIRLTNLWS